MYKKPYSECTSYHRFVPNALKHNSPSISNGLVEHSIDYSNTIFVCVAGIIERKDLLLASLRSVIRNVINTSIIITVDSSKSKTTEELNLLYELRGLRYEIISRNITISLDFVNKDFSVAQKRVHALSSYIDKYPTRNLDNFWYFNLDDDVIYDRSCLERVQNIIQINKENYSFTGVGWCNWTTSRREGFHNWIKKSVPITMFESLVVENDIHPEFLFWHTGQKWSWEGISEDSIFNQLRCYKHSTKPQMFGPTWACRLSFLAQKNLLTTLSNWKKGYRGYDNYIHTLGNWELLTDVCVLHISDNVPLISGAWKDYVSPSNAENLFSPTI